MPDPTWLITWEPGVDCGVLDADGGISPTRTPLEMDLDNTGATDVYADLQWYLDNTADGTNLIFDSGEFRCDTMPRIGANKNGLTLSGQGDSTIIKRYGGGNGIGIGSDGGYEFPGGLSVADCTVSDGLEAGSDTLTIGDASGFTVNRMIMLMVKSDLTIPIVDVFGYDVETGQAPTRQWVYLISKTATTLTFFPPLYDDYGGGSLLAYVFQATSLVQRSGIENMLIDCSEGSSQAGITLSFARNCWFKGVRVREVSNYVSRMDDSLNCEIRRCYLEEGKIGGSNGAGLIMNTSHACIFEDNIIVESFPLIEVNSGSSGNLFSRNFCDNQTAQIGIDSNHAAGCQFNLYEGNRSKTSYKGFQSDGYYGSSRRDVVFRNYFKECNFYLNRFTREYFFSCNYLNDARYGDPFIGSESYVGTASLIDDMPWQDWLLAGTITTRTDDNNCVITLGAGTSSAEAGQTVRIVWSGGGRKMVVASTDGTVLSLTPSEGSPVLPALSTAVVLWPGALGFGEKDLDVETTLIKKGNRYNPPAFDPLDGDTPPSSYAYGETKPQWLLDAEAELSTTFNLAPYTPEDEEAVPSDTAIPAGYRYFNEPSGTGTLTCTTLNVTTFTIG